MDIFIQQDNARPHVTPNDPEVVAAGLSGGWHIKMRCQPPNSPDTNILDLGFFNSIQSLQHEYAPITVDELVDAVYTAFDNLSRDTLNDTFLTLQKVLECIMDASGDNGYKLPHQHKQRKKRDHTLPENVACSDSIYEKAMNALS